MAFGLHRLFSLFSGAKRTGDDGLVWRSGAGDPVLNLDADGAIMAASPAAQALIAGAGGGCDIAGRSLFDFVVSEDQDALKAAVAQAGAGGQDAAAVRIALRLRRHHAQQDPLATGPSAFVEIAFRRQGAMLAALLRERRAELSALRAHRAAMETKPDAGLTALNTASPAPGGDAADVLADLGHELKTPLNAIMGFAETMRAQTFGPLGHEKYHEYADLIHTSGAHLSDLITAILDRAKINAGRYEIAPALTEPGPLAWGCAEMVRGEAEKAGLALRVDIAADLPPVMLDSRAVRQILINLLTNAVKFTAEGEIGLNVAEHDGAIAFTITDTGVGMSQMALARLGERFTDIHKNGVRGTSGSGLGLSLAYSLARLHCGALSLSSAPGEGTAATLTLPAARTLSEMSQAGLRFGDGDIQSQLDRVAQYRRERTGRNAA